MQGKKIRLPVILIIPALMGLCSITKAQNARDCDQFNIAQIHSPDSSDTRPDSAPDKTRLVASVAGLGLTNWLLYQPFREAWWQEKRTSFHFYRGYKRTSGYWDFGWNDSLYGHMDKLGHFYSSKMISKFLTGLSEWIGFSRETSRYAGPVASFLFMLEIEIYDSFFEEWGFSVADLSANALGAFSPLLAEEMPCLNRFKLKFSYKPSDFVNDETHYINDYTGMTFWLSYDVDKDFPGELWPDFLNVAVGYSVDRPSHGDIELYLAPDIDWNAFSTNDNGAFNYLLKALDQFHFPCIAWKLTPSRKFYSLYY